MIKKTIEYDDFDGNRVSEDHYFNLGPSDIVDLEQELGGGIEKWIETEIGSRDPKRALVVFVKFIGKGYGVRVGATGFKKSEEISDDFLSSLAFQGLFDELMTVPGEANKFILAMLPKKLMERAEQVIKERGDTGVLSLPEVATEAKTEEETATGEQVSDGEFVKMREDMLSGLDHPRDADGQLLLWAFRDPTNKEQRSMSKAQFVDAMKRKNSDWEPPCDI